MRTLLHLTDLHVRAPGAGPSPVGVDALEDLERVVEAVQEADLRPAALLLGGDLADDGREPGAYDALRPAAEAAAARLGARLVVAAGNHDERTRLRAGMGLDAGGLAAPDAWRPGAEGPDAPVDHVTWLGGLRVLTLDTTTPGRVSGALEEAQTAWLAEELRTPAPEGTVLLLHHPPVPTPTALDELRLHDARGLEAALRGGDVAVALAGHLHHAAAGALGGVPVCLTPALSHHQDALAPADRLRTRRGVHLSRVDVVAPGAGGTSWAPLRLDAAPALADRAAQAMRDEVGAFEADPGA